MAVNLQQQLERVSAKALLVLEKYRMLNDEKSALESENERLKADLLSRDRELEQLRQKVEYQRIASTLVPDRADLEQTRALITNLVRDIDRCIADLMDA